MSIKIWCESYGNLVQQTEMKEYILDLAPRLKYQKLDKRKLNGKKLATAICNTSIFWV